MVSKSRRVVINLERTVFCLFAFNIEDGVEIEWYLKKRYLKKRYLLMRRPIFNTDPREQLLKSR